MSLGVPSGRRVSHVLLVEDDPGDVMMIEEAFERYAIVNPLHVAIDGEQAIHFLRRRAPYADAPRPALVILDLNLPRMDGREVLTEIKNDPELRSIPVVVLTTSAEEEDILQSYDAHANAYVTKPVALVEFMGAVRQIDGFFLEVAKQPPAPY